MGSSIAEEGTLNVSTTRPRAQATDTEPQFGMWRSEEGVAAHRRAVETDVATIARTLRDVLGAKLTNYGAGLKDPKAIDRYIGGAQTPRVETEQRLRSLFQVTALLLADDSPAVARAWMIGANPQLNDEAPIEMMHLGRVGPTLRAAESFALDG